MSTKSYNRLGQVRSLKEKKHQHGPCRTSSQGIQEIRKLKSFIRERSNSSVQKKVRVSCFHSAAMTVSLNLCRDVFLLADFGEWVKCESNVSEIPWNYKGSGTAFLLSMDRMSFSSSTGIIEMSPSTPQRQIRDGRLYLIKDLIFQPRHASWAHSQKYSVEAEKRREEKRREEKRRSLDHQTHLIH